MQRLLLYCISIIIVLFILTCDVNTQDKSVSATATDRVSGIEVSPGIVSADGRYSMIVSWRKPANSGTHANGEPATITEYIVYWQEGDTVDTNIAGKLTVGGSTTNTMLVDLKENTQYAFVVVAKNTAELISTFPEHPITRIVSPPEPQKPGRAEITGVHTTAVTADTTTLKIDWKAPKNTGIDANGKRASITQYTVYWQQGTTVDASVTTNMLLTPEQSGQEPPTSVEIPNLKPKTSYAFIVTTSNAVGTGDASTVYTITSERAPTSAPQKVEITDVTAGTASDTAATMKVEWNKPDPGVDSNGDRAVITQYTVYWQQGSTVDTSVTNNILITPKQAGQEPPTLVEIPNLKPKTAYAFSVTATNVIGTGSPGNVQTETTSSAAAKPAGAPTDFRAMAQMISDTIQSGTVKLTWKPPTSRGIDTAGNTGKILHYTIKWWKSTDASIVTTSDVGTSPTEYYATGLESKTEYTFSITTVNNSNQSSAETTSREETLDSDRTITSFKFETAQNANMVKERQGNVLAHTITVQLSDRVNLNILKPTIVIGTHASISPASGTQQNFSNPVTYTVTAEDGSKQIYSVKIERLRSAKSIASFKLEANKNTDIPKDLIGQAHTNNFVLSLPASVTQRTFIPTIAISGGAIISPRSGTQQNFSNPVIYTVTAEDGSKQAYTAKIETLSSDKIITSFQFETRKNSVLTGDSVGSIDHAKKTITVNIPTTLTANTFKPTMQISSSATISPANEEAQDFSKLVIYTVTAEDGTTQQYTVIVPQLVPLVLAQSNAIVVAPYSNNIRLFFNQRLITLDAPNVNNFFVMQDGIDNRVIRAKMSAHFPSSIILTVTNKIKPGDLSVRVLKNTVTAVDNSKNVDETKKMKLTTSIIEIKTWQDLQKISENLSGHYKLVQDITFPKAGSNGFPQAGFKPIGSEDNPFTGSFDGNGRKIIDLYIDRSTADYVGLFGYIGSLFEFKNLILENPWVKGKNHVGSLAGHARNMSIVNVHVLASKTSSKIEGGTYVGGLVGYFDTGIVIGSAAVDVVGIKYVGGLAGQYVSSDDVYGYATGSVTGTSYVGGFIGGYSAAGARKAGYATGVVSGNATVGGFSGFVSTSNTTEEGYSLSYIISTGASPSAVGPGIGLTFNQPVIYVGRTSAEQKAETGSAAGQGTGTGDHVGIISTSTPTRPTTPKKSSYGLPYQKGIIVEDLSTDASSRFSGFSFGTEPGQWTMGSTNWPTLNFPAFPGPYTLPGQSPMFDKPANFKE